MESVAAKPVSLCPNPTIANWTFLGDTLAPAEGIGILTPGIGLTQSFASGNPDRAISLTGFGVPVDTNDLIEISVNTDQYIDIELGFDYRSTSTGPKKLNIEYSSDGVTFLPFTTITLTNDSNFHLIQLDMSSVTSLNGNPNIKFRIYGYDATSSGGTFRLDNVLVSGKCPYFPLKLIINEIAWAGTVASSDDEWIELYNPGSSSVDLTGWRLIAVDGSPDITLSGILAANDYYLLERGSDNAVQGNFADLVFTGDLGDTGEILRLRAPDGTIVDTANIGGGSWYAGSSLPPRSMERVGTVADGNLSWTTFQGVGSAVDAGNNPIHGTPGTSNTMTNITPTFTPSVTPSPTNTPTFTPTFTQTPSHTPTASGFRSVIINEIAWAGTASSLTDDEWIELYNPTALEVNITNWQIKAADGSPTIILSGKVPAGGYFLLERGDSISDDSAISDIAADQIYTSGSLSNTGEAITLYDGANTVIDTANGNGGAWPKGSSSTYESMERTGASAESDSAWHTNTSTKRNGKNANGGDILGTPKSSNSPVAAATATTTSAPTATSAPDQSGR